MRFSLGLLYLPVTRFLSEWNGANLSRGDNQVCHSKARDRSYFSGSVTLLGRLTWIQDTLIKRETIEVSWWQPLDLTCDKRLGSRVDLLPYRESLNVWRLARISTTQRHPVPCHRTLTLNCYVGQSDVRGCVEEKDIQRVHLDSSWLLLSVRTCATI